MMILDVLFALFFNFYFICKKLLLVVYFIFCSNICCRIILLFYFIYGRDDDDDDDDDADADAVVESTEASQSSSANITSCSLGPAIVAEAQTNAASQLCNDPRPQSVTNSAYPLCISQPPAPTHDSPSMLTRQQVYMLLYYCTPCLKM